MPAIDAFRWCCGLLGVYFLISSTELLYRRDCLQAGGLLSWDVLRLSNRFLHGGPASRLVSTLFSYPRVLALVVLRCGGGLLLVLGLFGAVPIEAAAVGIVISALTSVLLSYRQLYGNDGADQMALIASVALSVGWLARSVEYALAFVAFQVLLAYVTAGTAKLVSRQWRDGTALLAILSTDAFGRESVRRLVGRRLWLTRTLSWTVIVLLAGSVVPFALGGRFLLVALGLTLGFHVANAFVMRLHTFVWAFSATYPAVIFVRYTLVPLLFR